MKLLKGVGASAGVAVAPVLLLHDADFVVPDADDPMEALKAAAAAVVTQLQSLSSEAGELGRTDAAEVLQAQSFMAMDPMIEDAVQTHLTQGSSFDDALRGASADLSHMLASLPDPYLAARAADIGEVLERIRHQLAGLPAPGSIDLTTPSVLCAETLTAAQTALLDPTLVLGLATVEGGPTSHVAIIARALGVPAVVGVAGLVDEVANGVTIALDGTTGEFVVEPDDVTSEEFGVRAEQVAQLAAAAAEFRGRKISVGDRAVHISANVANEMDLDRAVEAQADGIGLFRTEFLFLDRPAPPTEDEQFEVYAKALKAFAEPVTIRTFDIGGDKPASFLDLPAEENPFLGVRGVRLYEHEYEMFLTQLRALLRAAPFGDLWVMIPMIATDSEITFVHKAFDEARAQLDAKGVDYGRISLGAMVEVPSAALQAMAMSSRLDFMSIGTNDLTQYTLAADRTNGAVDQLTDFLHPAVLQLCQMTAEAGVERGIPVSVCGLAAADPLAAKLFVEMGISKLSVAGPSVNLIKADLASMQPDALSGLADAVASAAEAADVRRLGADYLT
ncbi:MAG: phosphoenolpyruvate--protein phosphotransferase [Acidimicrobiales bacterium]|nr:phosphoenolpyruvate--protein phosphotransferase [Acidimicrobiales bacterium]